MLNLNSFVTGNLGSLGTAGTCGVSRWRGHRSQDCILGTLSGCLLRTVVRSGGFGIFIV